MNTMEIIVSVILFLISACFFTVAFFQYKEKGFLYNNAYIYASKEERNKMNKKPYYRQSAIVFTLLGVLFLVNAINVIVKIDWLLFVIIGLIALVVVYAIISSVAIKNNNR